MHILYLLCYKINSGLYWIGSECSLWCRSSLADCFLAIVNGMTNIKNVRWDWKQSKIRRVVVKISKLLGFFFFGGGGEPCYLSWINLYWKVSWGQKPILVVATKLDFWVYLLNSILPFDVKAYIVLVVFWCFRRLSFLKPILIWITLVVFKILLKFFYWSNVAE